VAIIGACRFRGLGHAGLLGLGNLLAEILAEMDEIAG
jgi:hypothetical protein